MPTAGRPLLQVEDLKVHFPVRRGALFQRTVGTVKAVDGVSFEIARGSVMGLVGESGCGKTTIAQAILKLIAPSSGRILFDGADIQGFDKSAETSFRRRVQAVFQDPYSSLNPRMSVREIVGEPLIIHRRAKDRRGVGKAAIEERVRELLDLCGLPARMIERYPHEMSGGQRQRIGIARALALEPDLVVCDEAVSALDVSIQAQVINLLEDLKDELGLTYLFIGHDLSVVKHLCDHVVVLYLGRVAEQGDSDALFAEPRHPYTQALLEAVPIPDPGAEAARAHKTVTGEIPSPLDPPSGCVFRTRCPIAADSCASSIPTVETVGPDHGAACLRLDYTSPSSRTVPPEPAMEAPRPA